ncbi:hypothetical protein [Pyrococcus horikoshii]|uniref:Uncharacterized protein n=2 Tax=Pyrococcus horikoshii TaxID=53953 RepID=O58886_PYRHO|nr:hypothetical protein [Pyrococcus horikoshii]BAA30248.1 180aa long hypothetical protein [Pyrococcus horikoshii OT3]HII61813.1 hypothetical protein [Pyrococcus horikoshii]
MKEIELPYIIFRTKSGLYGIDAYTALRVEKPERVATLIRKFNRMPEVTENHEFALIKKNEVEEFLYSVLKYAKEKASSKMKERVSKMRRWGLFRLLGIPTGHSRHISEEERLAKENREALLALSILETILKGNLEVLGYSSINVEVREDGIYVNGELDRVYTELIKVDMRAAMALLELAR